MEGQSEVARIRRQIEIEYLACQRVFTDTAITSRHDFIETRQARIGEHFEELKKHMTPDEAMQVFISIAEGKEDAPKSQEQQTPIVQSPPTNH